MNSVEFPLVSCIMPTRNRRRFVRQSISYFLRQDYPNRELVIVDDGEDAVNDLIPNDNRIHYMQINASVTLGEKRNIACDKCRGKFIAHWDDDDWIAPIRLSLQVQQLCSSGADMCGASNLRYYCPASGKAWLYRPPADNRTTIVGGTLMYRREVWEQNRFLPLAVGEDCAFVNRLTTDQKYPISDTSWYVAILHGGNSGVKNLRDPCWKQLSVAEVGCLLGIDRNFYAALRRTRTCGLQTIKRSKPSEAPPSKYNKQPEKIPLVTCIMPTRDRRRFVPQSIDLFLRQDYPRRELIIVDDGTDPIGNLIPTDPRITYFYIPPKRSIGVKRNLACEAASGDIIALWDDDDWYGSSRLSYQVEPLLEGRAEATGIGECILYLASSGQFWAPTPQLQNQMFAQGVIGGTLVFWKKFWQEGARFPDSSLAEDVAVQHELIRKGLRLEMLPNPGVFVYVRHEANTWRFSPEKSINEGHWASIDPSDVFLFGNLGEVSALGNFVATQPVEEK